MAFIIMDYYYSGTLINRKTSDRLIAANIFLYKLPKKLHEGVSLSLPILFIVYLCHRDKHCTHAVTDPDTPLAEVIKCGLEMAETTPGSENNKEEENSGPGSRTETEADGSVDGDKKHATRSLTKTECTSTDGSVDGDKKRATRSLTETECTSTDGSVDGDKKRATRFSTIVL